MMGGVALMSATAANASVTVAVAPSVAFVIPGDLNMPTGGYGYDRRVLARLAAYGVDVAHLPLTGAYPSPTAADLAETEAALATLPETQVLFIDGLAFGAMGFDLVQRIKQPIVALCHHPLALEAGLSEARAAQLHLSERNALSRARHVVVTSPMTARILSEDFGVNADRILVAEPGTDRATRAKGSANAAGGSLHLLAVGSIVPRKGYDVLVRALAPLADRPWTLSIVGAARDAERLAALEAQIAEAGLADRIRLLGARTEAELDEIYASADVFVMPSLFEGYGMVLGEAMARGLPIVCTTGGAAAETAPNTAALKVAPGDAAAFGAAVAKVLDDAVLRRGMSDAAWAAGLMLPTWDDAAKRIAAVLRAVARGMGS
jgi:glycosyltransferase involved in cell wall biosynthesis